MFLILYVLGQLGVYGLRMWAQYVAGQFSGPKSKNLWEVRKVKLLLNSTKPTSSPEKRLNLQTFYYIKTAKRKWKPHRNFPSYEIALMSLLFFKFILRASLPHAHIGEMCSLLFPGPFPPRFLSLFSFSI